MSIATVSRVLGGSASTATSTRERVLDAAAALAYVPPRQGRRRREPRQEAYGLVLPDVEAAHAGELLLGFGAASSAYGQSVSLLVTQRRPDASEAVRGLAKNVDGMAIASTSVGDPLAQSLGRQLPVVLVGRPALPGCDSVAAENVDCARRLTEHLIWHGCRHLVFVGDPDAAPESAERYRGFRLGHAASGMTVRRPPLRVPSVEGAGIQVADEILRRRVRLDGLVCASDELAVAVMRRLQESKVSLPEDLAVVGWGDIMTARYMSPALTTVRLPSREMGRIASGLLHRRLSGGHSHGRPRTLDSELVVRSSCGCPDREREKPVLSVGLRHGRRGAGG